MTIDWEFTAETFLDQLSPQEQRRVLLAVDTLEKSEDGLMRVEATKVGEGKAGDLYSMRVGQELRLLLSRRDDRLTVVDIVRRGQVEGLRSLARPARHIAG